MIEGSYLVAFTSVEARDAIRGELSRRSAASAAAAAANASAGATPTLYAEVGVEYKSTFPGFALSASQEALDFLASRPEVVAIVQDHVVRVVRGSPARGGSLRGRGSATGEDEDVVEEGAGARARAGAAGEEEGTGRRQLQQQSPPWGLDRIDQRSLPLNSLYSPGSTGAGVRAYVVDTGIRLTHSDFGGRAVTGIDIVTRGGSATDCDGHGTHVAGTACV